MDKKILFPFVMILLVGHISSLTYNEAFEESLKQYNLPNDEPMKAFLKNGKFASDEERTKLKCFFSTLTTKLGVSENDGTIDGKKVKDLAAVNPTDQELSVFAMDEVQKKCLPQANAPTTCDKVFNFIECASGVAKELSH